MELYLKIFSKIIMIIIRKSNHSAYVIRGFSTVYEKQGRILYTKGCISYEIEYSWFLCAFVVANEKSSGENAF